LFLFFPFFRKIKSGSTASGEGGERTEVTVISGEEGIIISGLVDLV